MATVPVLCPPGGHCSCSSHLPNARHVCESEASRAATRHVAMETTGPVFPTSPEDAVGEGDGRGAWGDDG